MRVFIAVRHSIDPDHFYGGLWSDNFYPALRKMGHEIIESKVDLLACSRFMDAEGELTQQELAVRGAASERILDEVRSAQRSGPVDLFLSYFYNSHFDPSGFDELRRLGIPSVNFYCNSIYQFSLVSSIAVKVDYSWHTERDAHSAYVRAGANPVWVQLGADPDVCHPVAGTARLSAACFVGQRYADRDRWIAALVDADVPIDVFGSGWAPALSHEIMPAAPESASLGRRCPPPGSAAAYLNVIRASIGSGGLLGGLARLSKQYGYRKKSRLLDTKMRQISRGRSASIPSTLAQYEVVINLSNVWADGRPGSKLIPHVRLRDFEAPMCRTCYLSGHTDEIAEFYEIGKEIDTYASEGEFVDKARFYLVNPTAAESLREKGYRRALRDHTWVCRFQELFRKIGLSNLQNR